MLSERSAYRNQCCSCCCLLEHVLTAHLADLAWRVCVPYVPSCLSPSCQTAVRWRIWCPSSSAACGGSPGCWRRCSARWPRPPERPRSWRRERRKHQIIAIFKLENNESQQCLTPSFALFSRNTHFCEVFAALHKLPLFTAYLFVPITED